MAGGNAGYFHRKSQLQCTFATRLFKNLISVQCLKLKKNNAKHNEGHTQIAEGQAAIIIFVFSSFISNINSNFFLMLVI